MSDNAGWSRGPQLEKLVSTSCGLSFSSNLEWASSYSGIRAAFQQRRLKAEKLLEATVCMSHIISASLH